MYLKRFGIERRIKFLLRSLNSTILYRILSDISVPNDYLFLFPLLEITEEKGEKRGKKSFVGKMVFESRIRYVYMHR